jgi:hypothetical protein
MGIPANYRVLYMQGGGTGQFACVPLNLLGQVDGTPPARGDPRVLAAVALTVCVCVRVCVHGWGGAQRLPIML